VDFEVGDGEVNHDWKTPAVRARVSLISVVTIGLGGLMGLSKGLATRRERDLDRCV
jgi:hypothetical protein